MKTEQLSLAALVPANPLISTLNDMKIYVSDHGLLVDQSTQPPTCCGYIFNFSGHGGFAPDGKVQLQNGIVRDLTQAEIETHNGLLAEAELKGLDENCEVGQGGTFYWDLKTGVMTWTGVKVADYTLNPRQTVLTFKRKGKVYRGRLQKRAQCFNFKRIS